MAGSSLPLEDKGKGVARPGGRLFYGWFIVAVAFLADLVGVGISTYAFGVLIIPMSESLGWSRAMMVGATTIAGIVGGLMAPWVGRLLDRRGARAVMVVSAILAGATLMALSSVENLWQFYLIFGLGIGLTRPGLEGLAATTAVANWFVKKRGRAMAVAASGSSLGAAIMVPITQYVVVSYGWRAAWAFLGGMKWVILVLPAWFFMRRRPEDMGLRPDGAPPEGDGTSCLPEATTSLFQEGDWEPQAAVRTGVFWLVLITFLLTGIALSGTVLHIVPHYRDRGLSPATAAAAMSSFSLAAFIAKAFWGFLAERLPIRYCVILLALSSAFGIALITLVKSAPMAFLSSVVWGLGVGGTGQLQSQTWPDYFGRKAVGAIRGYATLFQVFGGALAPLFSAWVYDVTKSYNTAFIIFIGACLLGALVMYLARPPLSPYESDMGGQ